jgi:hypothetical protein
MWSIESLYRSHVHYLAQVVLRIPLRTSSIRPFLSTCSTYEELVGLKSNHLGRQRHGETALARRMINEAPKR